MQRSGPLFAKCWQDSKAPTPRGQNRGPNPIPQGSGIIDRLKRATSHDERILLRDEARGFQFISKRTARRVANS